MPEPARGVSPEEEIGLLSAMVATLQRAVGRPSPEPSADDLQQMWLRSLGGAAHDVGRNVGTLHRQMQSGTVPTGIPESWKPAVRGATAHAFPQVETLADILDPRDLLNVPARMRDAMVRGAQGGSVVDRAAGVADFLANAVSALPQEKLVGGLSGAMVLGPAARHADLKMLEKAKTLEKAGVGKDQIRAATSSPGKTGWYRDIDGRMRFEVSDADASIATTLDARRVTTLGDLLSHDELYSQYPILRQMPVKIVNEPRSPSKGSVRGGFRDGKWTGDLTINIARLNDPAEIRKTVLHETQHAVQELEKFARGGNPDMMTGGMADLERKWLKRDLDRLEGKTPEIESFKAARPWLANRMSQMMKRRGLFQGPEAPRTTWIVDGKIRDVNYFDAETRQRIANEYNAEFGLGGDAKLSWLDIPDKVLNLDHLDRELDKAQASLIRRQKDFVGDPKNLLVRFHNLVETQRARTDVDEYTAYRELLGELEANMTGHGGDLTLADLLQPSNAPWRRRRHPDVTAGGTEERVILPGVRR